MFKLILLFILFVIFSISYFFNYMYTIPYFNFISHTNFYEYILEKLENRAGVFTGIDKTIVTINGKNYLADYSGGVLLTDLKYLSPKSDKLALYVPIFILHTGTNILSSGDSQFSGLKLEKDFNGYYQIVSGGNDYIEIGEEIVNKQKVKETFYLGNMYLYCSMTGTKWKDAYLYDRYLTWNKSGNYAKETKNNGQFVCENNYKLGEYKKTECVDWGWMGFCTKTEEKTYYACTCDSKGEYEICYQNNDLSTNPYNKICINDGNCIDYFTGTIDLNTTNCSLSGALGTDNKKKYFLVR